MKLRWLLLLPAFNVRQLIAKFTDGHVMVDMSCGLGFFLYVRSPAFISRFPTKDIFAHRLAVRIAPKSQRALLHFVGQLLCVCFYVDRYPGQIVEPDQSLAVCHSGRGIRWWCGIVVVITIFFPHRDVLRGCQRMVFQCDLQSGNGEIILIDKLQFQPESGGFTTAVNNLTFGCNTGDNAVVSDDFHANSFWLVRVMVASYSSLSLTQIICLVCFNIAVVKTGTSLKVSVGYVQQKSPPVCTSGLCRLLLNLTSDQAVRRRSRSRRVLRTDVRHRR